ncbi:hypothetical protein GCM10009718_27070 [Isoptericola halotolerans]|uniref:Glycosyltransferase involved in cell wall biosynthesis n=1 Tax=Isoptericola halotolerans TaxID=300560 RepID=A0ABX2A3Y0_9MICO|nr:glycosyltransferase involved in cell wall biosynthesis [Isoptericola halotolerans]
MTVPAVSVVVATNRGPDNPYLAEALASVCAQTLRDIELVVVDDGGPLPFEARDLPVAPLAARVVRTAGRGPAEARNIGAAQARGTLLAFLDDDDTWDPDRLERHARAMQADPTLSLTYCPMDSVDACGRVINPADQVPVATTADVYRRRTGILLPNTVVRAEAFRAVGGFDGSLRLAEDLDLVLRLADHGRVAMVGDRSLVAYRRHPDNATRRHRELAAAIRDVLARRLRSGGATTRPELHDALVEAQAANDRYAAWSAGRAARAALRDGDLRATGAEIFWALRFAPRAPLQAVIRRVARPRARPAARSA